MTLANIYAPNQDTPSFFDTVGQNLMDFNSPLAIVGDFNLVLDPSQDRLISTTNNKHALEHLKSLMDDLKIEDTWRVRNEHVREYSWSRGSTQASRIDMILLQKGLDNLCENILYTNSILSDHRIVFASIKDNTSERGKGYWKLNVSVLQYKQTCDRVKAKLRWDIHATSNMEPVDRWIYIKKKAKKYLQHESRVASETTATVISNLCEFVNNAEANLPLKEKDMELYLKSKEDLNQLSLEKARRLIFRSKVRWAEEGEKNTKYFFALERAKSNAKTCLSLVKDDGTELDDFDSILKEQYLFYKDLYTADRNISFQLENNTRTKLTDEQYKNLNIGVSYGEVAAAVKSMQNNKSPGPDGLPIEFYKIFWDLIGDILYTAYEECCRRGSMFEEAMDGVLNLIPKQNKDTRYLKNLRPITLLNCDYKIIEKVIANRIKGVLPDLIDHDQTGFMCKRRIAVNIRRVLDIMNLCDKQNISGIVMDLDYMKAFDRVEFTCIKGSLKYFNFPDTIIKWVEMLYSGFTIRVQNNGHFSERINIERSVHQGGCASAFLYILAAETLAIELRKQPDIQSPTVNGVPHTLSQYADDIDLFSIFSQASLNAIIKTLDSFHQHSGFKINYDKTSIYRIGSAKNSLARLYTEKPIAWTNDSLLILGVHVTDAENLLDINYNPVLQKSAQILQKWRSRGLSLFGKILVVNSLIASLFVHKMTTLPNLPLSIKKELNNMIQVFLWDGRKPKVALETLRRPKNRGGANLVDIEAKEKSLKISWIKILKDNPKYADLAYSLFAPQLQENIFRCNIASKDCAIVFGKNPCFWADVMTAWSEINFDARAKARQIIWLNSLIRVKGEPILYQTAYENGLLWVDQLCTDGHFISAHQAYQRFNLTVMEYNSIIAAIPKWLKDKVKSVSPYVPALYDQLVQKEHLTQHVYREIIEGNCVIEMRLSEKWCRAGLNVTQSEMQRAFKNIYTVTNLPKLRSFQYRTLHAAIVVNSHLFRWDLREDNLCTFCREQKETVIHLFCECSVVVNVIKNFVSRVILAIYEKAAPSVEWSSKNIILNQIVQQPNHLVNYACLFAKQYVYKTRCVGKNLSVADLYHSFMSTKNTEKYIAIKNSHVKKFNRKWNCDFAGGEEDILSIEDYVQMHFS